MYLRICMDIQKSIKTEIYTLSVLKYKTLKVSKFVLNILPLYYLNFFNLSCILTFLYFFLRCLILGTTLITVGKLRVLHLLFYALVSSTTFGCSKLET